jgi:Trk K+ transport system NAD-binding subunit
MRTLIVGAERVGRALAHELLAAGDDVRVLDGDAGRLSRLGPALEGQSLHGSPLDRDTLAGALAGCDGIATTTGDDALNAVVALAARRELGAPIVVAVIGNPARAQALTGLGVHVHCPTTRTARELHAALMRSPVEQELELGAGAGVYRVQPSARMTGRELAEIDRTGELAVVAVERDGRVLLARRGVSIQDGDVLHVAAVRHDLVAHLAHP